MILKIWLIISLVGKSVFASITPHRYCERVNTNICSSLDKGGYQYTSFPNFFNHTSQVAAIVELEQFKPLINSGCARHLALFLCSLYIPFCMPTPEMAKILPCRSLCESTREGCEPILRQHNYTWPNAMGCSQFSTNEVASCIKAPKNKVKKAMHVVMKKRDSKLLQCGEDEKIAIRKVCHSPLPAQNACDVAAQMSRACQGKLACFVRFTRKRGSLGRKCFKHLHTFSFKYQCVGKDKQTKSVRTCSKALNRRMIYR